jgi:membrane protein insertase Oxa1/YidC/SpoIIIJ
MPIFIGMFFGMKKMPEIFPAEMSSGGLAWFADLTVPDPTYILPMVCGLSFLATIESGKEQMIDGNPKYGPALVNGFRGMCLIMVPVMTTFPAAMLCYWVPNNILTMVQSITLRNPWVMKQLGIWERPKPVPGMKQDVGIQETIGNLVKQVKGEPTTPAEKIKAHNDEIETKKLVAGMSKATRARRREGVTIKKKR